MRSRATHLVSAIGTAVLMLFTAAPAQVAPGKKPVTMTFSASPASVTSGAPVTLAGRAKYGRTGNAGRVDLYFLERGATAWAFTASARAASNGSFRRVVRASAGGTFRAVYRGNATRKAAVRYDAITVQSPPAPPVTAPQPPEPKQPVVVTLEADGVQRADNSFWNVPSGKPFTVTGTATGPGRLSNAGGVGSGRRQHRPVQRVRLRLDDRRLTGRFLAPGTAPPGRRRRCGCCRPPP
ncbi:hypothetical protein [Spirilliplanes yamanashiensis]|uniref:Uncharacterized protein n=1 Tax=Spirilliplanes yamanashiensis TaxID=42233 RepID=A0A8J3YD73_9ACTN|nr:hypothetical protein [Spirilliplanes yamanashiensis]MDP9816283.1 hypothetical protein [Spirilliplanes yamanashiensis]GIJ05810.1 hypothetical protein Sya03_51620 [Spirilliplanes yamanashiensis]